MAGGVSFRETMQGPFAMGASTPEQGAERGRREGSELAMRVQVEVADLDAFLAERQASGRLTGEVDCPALGAASAKAGVFQLFSAGPVEDARRMVYELALTARGKPYYLAGEKRVRNEPGFDLWVDTTTLYTHLYEGKGKDGAIVGAGILQLGVKDLLNMLTTLRPTRERDVGAVVRFGRFFLGELWDIYAPQLGTPDQRA